MLLSFATTFVVFFIHAGIAESFNVNKQRQQLNKAFDKLNNCIGESEQINHNNCMGKLSVVSKLLDSSTIDNRLDGIQWGRVQIYLLSSEFNDVLDIQTRLILWAEREKYIKSSQKYLPISQDSTQAFRHELRDNYFAELSQQYKTR